MASVPLPSWSDQTRPGAGLRVTQEPVSTLSHLEWAIVAMAEHDGLSSLRTGSGFWSLFSAIFGIKPANRLANDRLEALRRVAVLAWRYRWNVPSSELDAFFDAGYSPAQYEQLQRKIAAVRSQSRRTAR